MELMSEIERLVVETLAGGQTRSALELVTELQVPFPEIDAAISRLCDAGVLRESYASDGESFLTLADAPVPST
jgi:hypothetical protein